MTTKTQYQKGNLTRRKRAKGADVWQFRWWGLDDKGRRAQRSRLIGTVEEYPAQRAAQRAVDAVRLEINAELPKAVPVNVSTLVERYLNDSIEMGRLAYSTKLSYTTHLRNWVSKHWGQHKLEDVRTMAVEQWLRDLELAPRTKVHIRNVFHVLYECAGRWELVQNNPITRVRQGGYRRSDPDILTAVEFQALRHELTSEVLDRLAVSDKYREAKEYAFDMASTMVVLAVCLGLTRSEFTGLKWSDFNWKDAVLTIQRGVVNNHVGNPKTLARRKPLPLAPEVVAVLEEWRSKTPYRADSDWVFASPTKDGATPYSPDSLLKKIVQPAAKRAKITKRIGWHSMRHTYSTLLRANGADIKVQQELMRHSTIEMTLQTYTQAVSEQKRAANALVVGQLLNNVQTVASV
jgi:integrase